MSLTPLPPAVVSHQTHTLNEPEHVNLLSTPWTASNKELVESDIFAESSSKELVESDILAESSNKEFVETDIFANPSSSYSAIPTTTATTTTTHLALSEKPLPSAPESEAVMGIAGANWASSLLAKANASPTPKQGLWAKFRKRTGRWAWWIVGAVAVVLVVLIIIISLAAAGVLSPHGSKSSGSSEFTGKNGVWNMTGNGDGTYYSPSVGTGACGWLNQDTDMVVALNVVDYGVYANPNDAVVCGKCVSITGPLGTTQAEIADKCPVCKKGDIDMSPAVFDQIADPAKGRVHITWHGC